MSHYKARKRLIRAFGKNEAGLPDVPARFSNVQYSRVLYGDYMGCGHCFPHGFETVNCRLDKIQRNWKKHRRTQWKELPPKIETGETENEA